MSAFSRLEKWLRGVDVDEPSGSSSRAQSRVDNCEEACKGMLTCNFVGNKMTSVKTSPFEASDDAISRLARIHGLRTDDLDGAGCRRALAFHLMNVVIV
jgi:hypothetical protein